MSEDYRMSSLIVMTPPPPAVCLELFVNLERVNIHCSVAVYSCSYNVGDMET